jgi:hypothetical protein
MSAVSLEELGSAFETWRKNKRNARELVPKALWEQTLLAVEIHGTLAVSRVTKIQRSRIVERAEKGKGKVKGKGKTLTVPAFSQVTISPPSVPGSPVAEMETAIGLKLRIFVQSDEMVKLLLTLCSSGGTR